MTRAVASHTVTADKKDKIKRKEQHTVDQLVSVRLSRGSEGHSGHSQLDVEDVFVLTSAGPGNAGCG